MKLNVGSFARLAAGLGVLCGLGPTVAFGIVVPDNIRMLVTKAHAVGVGPGFYGTIGSFCYDEANNRFYTVIFGSGKGMRMYDVDLDVSDHYIWDIDLNLFCRASDVPGGVTDADDGANYTLMAILLNPTTLNVGGLTYNPGELGIVLNYAAHVTDGGIIPKPEWSKAIIRWDLRKVYWPTSEQPDYNNAQDGQGRIIGAYGWCDWNDALTVAATNQDFNDAAGVVTRPYIGRQFAWSTEGKHIYVTDHGKISGGVYKVNIESGATWKIHPDFVDPNTSGLYEECAVLSSTVRHLGQESGDQVLIAGHEDFGTEGGVSYIVDDANTITGPYVLISTAELQDFLELHADPDPNYNQVARIRSFAADQNGNIYFYDAETYAVHMYDTLGRLVTLKNKAQQYAFNVSQGGNGVQGGSLRLQTRQVVHDTAGALTEVMFRGYNSWALGLYVFRPGDFNRDDVLDANDTGFFIDQFRVSQAANGDPNNLPTLYDPNGGYVDYCLADLNGSAMPYRDSSYTARLEKIAVTAKDLEVLLQFASLWKGDLDWDGDVDATDLATLIANKGMADPIWFDGDLDQDNDVDDDDQAILEAQLGNAYTIDPGEHAWGGLLPVGGPYHLTIEINDEEKGSVSVDPNLPEYPANTEVTLTAIPFEGKSFKKWKIYDPNYPGDSNHITIDTNSVLTLVMDGDYVIRAMFGCGSGVEQALPILVVLVVVGCGIVAGRRRG